MLDEIMSLVTVASVWPIFNLPNDEWLSMEGIGGKPVTPKRQK
jgi:hypothetical protein